MRLLSRTVLEERFYLHAIPLRIIGRNKRTTLLSPKLQNVKVTLYLGSDMEHEYYMREALKEAKKAFDLGEIPVGAVIVLDKKIIGKAHNQVEMLKDTTAHAEMLAITQASSAIAANRLNNASMYVTLEPCFMCAGALVLSRVKEIYYAAADPKTGACGSVYDIVNDPRLNHQIKIIHGLMRDESQLMIQEFFSKLREKNR